MEEWLKVEQECRQWYENPSRESFQVLLKGVLQLQRVDLISCVSMIQYRLVKVSDCSHLVLLWLLHRSGILPFEFLLSSYATTHVYYIQMMIVQEETQFLGREFIAFLLSIQAIDLLDALCSHKNTIYLQLVIEIGIQLKQSIPDQVQKVFLHQLHRYLFQNCSIPIAFVHQIIGECPQAAVLPFLQKGLCHSSEKTIPILLYSVETYPDLMNPLLALARDLLKRSLDKMDRILLFTGLQIAQIISTSTASLEQTYGAWLTRVLELEQSKSHWEFFSACLMEQIESTPCDIVKIQWKVVQEMEEFSNFGVMAKRTLFRSLETESNDDSQKVEAMIQNWIEQYNGTGQIPASIRRERMFQRTFYERKIQPALLSVTDSMTRRFIRRAKLVHAMYQEGFIPDSMYQDFLDLIQDAESMDWIMTSSRTEIKSRVERMQLTDPDRYLSIACALYPLLYRFSTHFYVEMIRIALKHAHQHKAELIERLSDNVPSARNAIVYATLYHNLQVPIEDFIRSHMSTMPLAARLCIDSVKVRQNRELPSDLHQFLCYCYSQRLYMDELKLILHDTCTLSIQDWLELHTKLNGPLFNCIGSETFVTGSDEVKCKCIFQRLVATRSMDRDTVQMVFKGQDQFLADCLSELTSTDGDTCHRVLLVLETIRPTWKSDTPLIQYLNRVDWLPSDASLLLSLLSVKNLASVLSIYGLLPLVVTEFPDLELCPTELKIKVILELNKTEWIDQLSLSEVKQAVEIGLAYLSATQSFQYFPPLQTLIQKLQSPLEVSRLRQLVSRLIFDLSFGEKKLKD